MGDAVGFMELGDCFFKRWEGGNLDLRKCSESLSLGDLSGVWRRKCSLGFELVG